MENKIENNVLDSLSVEQIESLEGTELTEIINTVETNTKWEDTSKHMTMNGAKMNC